MAVIFNYPATDLTIGASTITLDNVVDITKVMSGASQKQTIRHIENTALTPIYIQMGYNPISVTFSGFMDITTTLTSFLELMPDIALYVSSSTYSELPVSTYWEIDKTSTERSIGFNNNAKYTISLLQQEHIGVR